MWGPDSSGLLGVNPLVRRTYIDSTPPLNSYRKFYSQELSLTTTSNPACPRPPAIFPLSSLFQGKCHLCSLTSAKKWIEVFFRTELKEYWKEKFVSLGRGKREITLVFIFYRQNLIKICINCSVKYPHLHALLHVTLRSVVSLGPQVTNTQPDRREVWKQVITRSSSTSQWWGYLTLEWKCPSLI